MVRDPASPRRAALAVSLVFPWFFVQLPPSEPPAATPEPPAAEAPHEEPLVLPGVVIEEIPKGSALEKAGLQVGDVVLAWERLPNPPANPEGASGVIESPFDWMWLEIEQAPRGVVRLRGERGQAGFHLSLGEISPVDWSDSALLSPASYGCNAFGAAGSTTSGERRPSANQIGRQERRLATSLSGQCWLFYKTRALFQALGAGESKRTASILETLDFERIPRSSRPAALLLAADAALRSANLPLARVLLEPTGRVLRADEAEGALAARALIMLADLARMEGNLRNAARRAQRAAVIAAKVAADSMLEADALNLLGVSKGQLGEIVQARNYLLRAEAIAAQAGSCSPRLAKLKNNLGIMALLQGSLDEAKSYLLDALATSRCLTDGADPAALALGNLGVVYRDLGDLDLAEKYSQEAVALRRATPAWRYRLPTLLGTLGNIARQRGDLEEAERFYLEALEINLEQPALVTSTISQYTSLAALEIERGATDAAGEYLRLAEASIPEGAGPTLAVQRIFENQAIVAHLQGDLEESETLHRKALGICRGRSSLSADCAAILNGLGVLKDEAGDIQGARSLFYSALRGLRKPGRGRDAAVESQLLANLGHTYLRTNQLGRARKLHQEALQLLEPFAAEREGASYLLGILGQIEIERGHPEQAEAYLSRSVRAVDEQYGRFGSEHASKSLYRGGVSWRYRELVHLLVLRAAEKEAFRVSEDARARSFLDMVGARDRSFQRARNREKGRDWSESRSTAGLRSEEGVPAVATSEDSGAEFGDLESRQSLEIRGDPETNSGMVVSFFIWNDGNGGVAFVVNESGQTEEVMLFSLPNLLQEIERFSALVVGEPSGQKYDEDNQERRGKLSRRLYEVLVRPIEKHLADAKRILIIPDGPLHYLPWGALIREYEENGETKQQYLAEWKPFHSVLSATVFAELKKDRRDPAVPLDPGTLQFAAFGASEFPASFTAAEPEKIADLRVRSAARRGALNTNPLSYTRREVEQIAALFPPGTAQTFIGAEATEERAKAIGKGARILHFATHAHLDDRFPLNSSLLLSMPEGFPEDRENGLLQVWEIFEKVRLDADLVVLSACETALGEEQGGEGLIGLTRAFQYAGARSVLASLWSVNDQATSELMIRFYKQLLAGKSKDEALRAAQRELIAGPIEIVNDKGERELRDYSAPYYWAGFQLYGDWQ